MGAQTPTFGLPFEIPTDQPGITLTGGSDGMKRILADVVEEILLSKYRIDQGTYTPTLTSTGTTPNLGANGVIEGGWYRVGFGIWFWVRWLYSGAGIDGGSGQHIISTPFDADPAFNAITSSFAQATQVGSAFLFDDDTSANRQGAWPYLRTTTHIGVRINNATSGLAEGFPFSWDEGDAVTLSGSYIADPGGLP